MPKQSLLEKYAQLAVATGANVQKGQRVVLRTSTEAIELTREIAKQAYLAGAKQVHVIWGDEHLSKYGFTYAETETLADIPDWSVAQYQYYVDEGAAFISVTSPLPGLMEGVDGKKQQAVGIAMQKKLNFFREHTMGNGSQWTIVAASNPSWAAKVFPDLTVEKATEKLWDAIFDACRVYEDNDPVKDWETHNEALLGRNKLLNELNFKSLYFKNKAGTDLTVELIKDHVWAGGGEVARNGVYFNPNIPTEETFTMPYKWGTSGRVVATKPLAYRGVLIKDFWLEFKDGKVVSFDAKEGMETLQDLLNFDENARYIGEIALISHDSPISNTDILFLNTLFDENASCHMALGRAYPMNVKDGHTTPVEALEKKGYNNSMVHVDFMFGSADMSIEGLKQDGTKIVVFKDGNFII